MKSKWFLLLSVAIIMSMLLTACGKTSTSTKTTTQTTTQTQQTSIATTTSVTTATTPANQAKYGGTLRYSFNSVFPPELGVPWVQVNTRSFVTNQEAMAGLITETPEAAFEPRLAESWQWAADGTSITFKLKQGVTFHDGTEFNADAVKFNLDNVLANPGADFTGLLSTSVVDKYTFRMNMKGFNSMLLDDLAHQRGMLISPTAYQKNGKELAGKNPISAGPFKLVSYGETQLKYTRFENYVEKGLPYLDSVTWSTIEDPAVMLVALKAGNVDVIRGVEDKEASELKPLGYTIEGGTNGIVAYAPDTVNPASVFNNNNITKAIEYAIDKKAICDALGYGMWEVNDQLAPNSSYAFDPSVTSRTFNPSKATELLTAAGYGPGKTLKINLYNFSNVHENTPVAMQKMLKEVNVDANLVFLNQPDLLALRQKGGMPVNSMMMMFVSYKPDWLGRMKTILGETSLDYKDMKRTPGIDAVMDQALAAKDQATKESLARKAQAMMYNDAMYIPLYNSKNLWAYDGKKWHLEGLVAPLIMFTQYAYQK